ncbi:MarR family winged helix-turn-helix transcriptional regulator [Rothia sp. ZJ1223]|uniref:MarR family winged helix-turn-helix transcriptional regulator n=1 Tax=Rothia sp. ZJ1223 TaxID=2811098 RepID=UPI0019590BA1|nr:MarR family transcriptional regulator [Rothia sp. ZJ1223]MBM7050451.1 MarR family transcriptional regulator [Rothia sp. ZJ1223]
MKNFSQKDAANLHLAVFKLHRRLRAETATITQLSEHEENVLMALHYTPGLTNAELARHEHITPQSMNKITAAMLKHGVLESQKNVHDKRRKELLLTGQGRELAESVAQQRALWLAATVGQEFEPEEAQQLARVLPLLHRLSDKKQMQQHKFIPVAPPLETEI